MLFCATNNRHPPHPHRPLTPFPSYVIYQTLNVVYLLILYTYDPYFHQFYNAIYYMMFRVHHNIQFYTTHASL